MDHDAWEMARLRQQDQVFSTIFTAQSVDRQVNSEEGIAAAASRQGGRQKVTVPPRTMVALEA